MPKIEKDPNLHHCSFALIQRWKDGGHGDHGDLSDRMRNNTFWYAFKQWHNRDHHHNKKNFISQPTTIKWIKCKWILCAITNCAEVKIASAPKHIAGNKRQFCSLFRFFFSFSFSLEQRCYFYRLDSRLANNRNHRIHCNHRQTEKSIWASKWLRFARHNKP